METLAEFVNTLAQMCERYVGFASEEFCALVVGVGHLNDAMRGSEDEGKTEKAEKEDEENDLLAIAWRVEYDLARFVG